HRSAWSSIAAQMDLHPLPQLQQVHGHSCWSAALEGGLTLLEERGHALAAVARAEEHREGLRFERVRGVEWNAVAGDQRSLARGDGDRPLLGDLSGDLLHLAHELGVGNDGVDESDPDGVFRRDRVAGVTELTGTRDADAPGKALRAAEAWDDAEVH